MYGSSACTDSEGSAGITHHVFTRHQAACCCVAAPSPRSPAQPRTSLFDPATKTMLQPTRRRHVSSWNECNNNMFCVGLPVCWRWWGRVMMNKCDSIDRAEEVTGGALLAHCPTVSTTTITIIANITSVSQILPV